MQKQKTVLMFSLIKCTMPNFENAAKEKFID